MKVLIANVAMIFVLLTLQLDFTKADQCGRKFGKDWYCNAGRYCCGFNSYAALCCSYTFSVYTTWYFWVCIAIGIIITTIIAVCVRRYRMRQLSAMNNMRVATTTTVATSGTAPPPPPGYLASTKMEPGNPSALPPTYYPPQPQNVYSNAAGPLPSKTSVPPQ